METIEKKTYTSKRNTKNANFTSSVDRVLERFIFLKRRSRIILLDVFFSQTFTLAVAHG